jgi:Txe/YoeB family toxin of Txe-Axe toxin-antitoxin module
MRNWINIALETDVVDGSASKIIRDMHLVVGDFTNAYYNFDDCFDGYTPIEKQFFLDYCDVVMNSYKQRLKRIINNLVKNTDIEYKEYYQVNFTKSGKYGEYIATENIEDLETIDKINKAKHQVEVSYGAKENKDKWKLYCNRETSNKFQDDFIKKVRTLLKRDDIVNCYKAMFMCEHGTYEPDINENFDNKKFWKAQKKFAEDKIKTVFNKTNKIPLGFGKYEKLPKYRHEDISDDMIKDCKDMIVYESVS